MPTLLPFPNRKFCVPSGFPMETIEGTQNLLDFFPALHGGCPQCLGRYCFVCFLSTSRQNIDRPCADLYRKMACFRGPRLRTALRSPKPGGPLSRDCRGTVVCPIFGTAGRSSNGDRGTRVLPCFSRCVCTGCLPFFVCLLSGCLFVCLLFVCLLFVCLLVGWLVFGWWVGVVGVWQSSSCLVFR